MKRTMKRIIALVLVITMMFLSGVPVNAEQNGETIVEVVKDIQLRTGPGKSYEFLPDASLYAGDCVRVMDAMKNEYGNIWFKVAYAGGEGFIYENNCTLHTCSYNIVYDNEANPLLKICRCGNYEMININSATNTGAGLALGAGSLLGADALVSLGALGTTIGAVASAAFPYVAVVSVGGLIIYMAINSTGTQVGEYELSSKSELEDFESEENKEKPYYKAAAPKDSPVLYVKRDEPLSLEAANVHLLQYVDNPILTDRNGYHNIYTLHVEDANRLATRFANNGIGYEFGTSKDPNHNMEVDMNENKDYPMTGMFYHYHVYKRKGFDLYKKNKKCHIFFGYPSSYVNF